MIFSFEPPYPPAAVWKYPKPTIVRIRHQTERTPAMYGQIGPSLIGRGQSGALAEHCAAGENEHAKRHFSLLSRFVSTPGR